MELQKGNWWAAVRLLERCVSMDPANSPVLRWKPVASARKTVSERSSSRRRMRTAAVKEASASSAASPL
jgi:hypothetical protein